MKHFTGLGSKWTPIAPAAGLQGTKLLTLFLPIVSWILRTIAGPLGIIYIQCSHSHYETHALMLITWNKQDLNAVHRLLLQITPSPSIVCWNYGKLGVLEDTSPARICHRYFFQTKISDPLVVKSSTEWRIIEIGIWFAANVRKEKSFQVIRR